MTIAESMSALEAVYLLGHAHGRSETVPATGSDHSDNVEIGLLRGAFTSTNETLAKALDERDAALIERTHAQEELAHERLAHSATCEELNRSSALLQTAIYYRAQEHEARVSEESARADMVKRLASYARNPDDTVDDLARKVSTLVMVRDQLLNQFGLIGEDLGGMVRRLAARPKSDAERFATDAPERTIA